jgi:hypothetical protein
VALRFPGSRVWDLPFLAHEFGHHLVAQLPHYEPAFPDKRPLRDVVVAVTRALSAVDQPLPSDQATAHAHELVADAVATVCCGPTYPVACLCLRVPPGTHASARSATHPAWRDRVAATRATLEAFSDHTGLSRYRARLSSDVDPLVEALLGQVPSTPPAAAEAADRTVAAILRHRRELAYGEGDAAIEVAEGLRRNPRPSLPPAGATVAAVVDGAWQWRLTRTSNEDDGVAGLVVQLCRTIDGR